MDVELVLHEACMNMSLRALGSAVHTCQWEKKSSARMGCHPCTRDGGLYVASISLATLLGKVRYIVIRVTRCWAGLRKLEEWKKLYD